MLITRIMPKMIALLAVMPILVVYANFCGIIGGLFVGGTYLEQPVPMYVERTWQTSQAPSRCIATDAGIDYRVAVTFH